MERERFRRQLAFLVEMDKMKHVLRRTLLIDGSRRENDAEHSWHLALYALVLEEYAQERGIDMGRVLAMLTVHDLVEVYAGDTFAYDALGNEDKESRERMAADRLFGMLPEEQGRALRSLWEEFDGMKTPESIYAAAMDRLQPLVHNVHTKGHTWSEGGVTRAQVYRRMEIVKQGAPELWPFVEEAVAQGVENGYIHS